MNRDRQSKLLMALRAICLALLIQLIVSLLIDYGSPYVPFWVILLFYFLVIGIPLIIMLIILSQYCMRIGENPYSVGKLGFLRIASYAFPTSGLLRLCFGVLVTAKSNKLILLERSLKQLVAYIFIGVVLHFLYLLIVKRGTHKS